MGKKKDEIVKRMNPDDKRDIWASNPKPETTKERAIRLGIIPKPKEKKKDAGTEKEGISG